MVEVASAIVVDLAVFWLVAGGLVSLAVTVIMFEVMRMFKLVSAVRDIKDAIDDLKTFMERHDDKLMNLSGRMDQYQQEHNKDHELIKQELVKHVRDNDHEFDRVKDKLDRLESK